MLNDNHRIALVHQTVQHVHQYPDVFEVQACGRLVQNIHGLACIAFRKFSGELHTLAFASRQGGGRLPQLDIAQPYFLQHLNLIQNLWHVFEKLYRTVDGHIQHIGNRLSFETHLQSLAVVPLAVAHLTRHQHIGQEIHLNGLVTVSSACLAPAS